MSDSSGRNFRERLISLRDRLPICVVSDRQVERFALTLDNAAAKISSSIEAGAENIGAKAQQAIGGIAVGTLAFIVLRRRRFTVPPHIALMLKPKVDTANHARMLLSSQEPGGPAMLQKLQLEGVRVKALAFHITPDADKATEAFRNELECTAMDDEVKQQLKNHNFDLTPSKDMADQDFIVKGGKGFYYNYALRSTEILMPDSSRKISIAIMMCGSSFQTLQCVKEIEENVIEEPVYEHVQTALPLKRSFWRGTTEYEFVTEKKLVRMERKVTKTPIFHETAFTPKEIEHLQSHMMHKAAESADKVFNPQGRKLLTIEDAAQESK
eukprot:CAMPEP_0172725980 /NCGR_PEP_ID=MMETSP1074-20121228/89683_1 /TAXON_ID=2916 /ORGANISM="Ceratium fusus, Strain PA161109" /LENGTH=325 /DNA_ID=CAMNT_0013552873 /DNA_START=89 /DNA_END=1066 /DNA_ORIENTATION=+